MVIAASYQLPSPQSHTAVEQGNEDENNDDSSRDALIETRPGDRGFGNRSVAGDSGVGCDSRSWERIHSFGHGERT